VSYITSKGRVRQALTGQAERMRRNVNIGPKKGDVKNSLFNAPIAWGKGHWASSNGDWLGRLMKCNQKKEGSRGGQNTIPRNLFASSERHLTQKKLTRKNSPCRKGKKENQKEKGKYLLFDKLSPEGKKYLEDRTRFCPGKGRAG